MSAIDDVIKYVSTNEIKWIDLQFYDLKGSLHRTSISSRKLDESSFGNGVHAADLSEVFGQNNDELLLLPDPDTLARLPWEQSTIRLMCDVVSAVKKERFAKDPRFVAEKAETAVTASGVKYSLIGVDVDCNIFESATMDRLGRARGSGASMDSKEAKWSVSATANSEKGAYVATPYDSLYAARAQICETMEENFGMSVDSHRHGIAPTAQQTFALAEKSLKNAADTLNTLKFVTKNLANAINASATFMPYPVEGEKGNSLNIGISLWKSSDSNMFYESKDDYAQISQAGRYFIGGLLEHSAALSAFCAPTPNSYRKMAMDNKKFGWSHGRNALVYVPFTKKNVKETKRVVYTAADPSANPYLAYSLIVVAGLDGVKSKIEPGDVIESEGKKSSRLEKKMPTTLHEAIEALESDNKFIKGIVSSELLDEYVGAKKKQHLDSLKGVTSLELQKYFNV